MAKKFLLSLAVLLLLAGVVGFCGWKAVQLQQFPATFLYASDGTLMVKHTGAADWDAPSVVACIEGLKGKR